MSVSRCLFVDWSSKIKHLNDSCRAEIKILTNDLYQFIIFYCTCSECIYHDRCRMCYTDCIRQLNLTFLSKSCSNNILGNVTCCISGRTVNLCTVFSRESPAAVTCHSTVSIYDDLTSCKSTVSVWSADYKTSCRVDEELCLLIYHALRNDCIEYIFLNIFMDLILCHFRIMLCRKYDCIQTCRNTILIIFNRNLCLSIRS